MEPWQLDQIMASVTPVQANGARQGDFWNLAPFEGGTSWIGKWTGVSPWERHSRGDEFIHVLKGSVVIEVLMETGKKSVTVSEGSIFVVPKNHWHRQIATGESVVLGATPGITDHSDEEPQESPSES